MPTSILFTIPNFITAGSGRAMLNIIERLDRSRFAPAVCVMRKGGKLDQEVERMGIPFLEVPFTVPARPYLSLWRRARQASLPFRAVAPRFEIWHSFHYADDYTEPIIARLAGARAWVYTKKNMNWRQRAWHLRSLIAQRIAAQNTDMLREFFAAPWYRHKTRLVPRGVDLGRFSPGTSARLAIRAQFGIPQEAIVAACVAHLVPVKGHPTLLAAIAHVPHIHLLLVGSPLDEPYVAELKRQVRELGLEQRVHFLGGVDDIPAVVGESDVAVLPTCERGEGCPVALLEAMACGKACVATDVPGSRDLVVHGESGVLVPPEDIDSLATALQRLAADPAERRRLGGAARRRVEQHFSMDSEVAAHEALYQELVRA